LLVFEGNKRDVTKKASIKSSSMAAKVTY